jgi:hypothetical protein
MNRPVTYDITRLTTRVWNRTPNGIDRVDLAYARHFLEPNGAGQSAMLYLPTLGHRMLPRSGAFEVIDGINAHLGENDDPDRDPAYLRVKQWLRNGVDSSQKAPQRFVNARKHFAVGMADWVYRHGLPLGV